MSVLQKLGGVLLGLLLVSGPAYGDQGGPVHGGGTSQGSASGTGRGAGGNPGHGGPGAGQTAAPGGAGHVVPGRGPSGPGAAQGTPTAAPRAGGGRPGQPGAGAQGTGKPGAGVVRRGSDAGRVVVPAQRGNTPAGGAVQRRPTTATPGVVVHDRTRPPVVVHDHTRDGGWWGHDDHWRGWQHGYWYRGRSYWPRWWQGAWGWSIYAPYYIYVPAESGYGFYWYYCASSDAYYPDVPECPEGWQLIPAEE
jgi:hypothetical protein